MRLTIRIGHQHHAVPAAQRTKGLRPAVVAAASVLLAPLLAVPLAGPAVAHGGDSSEARDLASSTAVSWQRTAIRTIYSATEGAKAPPDGALYLAFTSLAVHDAAVKAERRGSQVAAAAVATAAHDVLLKYFPASAAALAADLTASLAMVPDGRKETVGKAIGAAAAAEMIASRVGDGRNNVFADGSTVAPYSKAPAPGIWQPPASGMALYWLGFVKPVIDVGPVRLDGPDALTSAAYARDYEEVRKAGELNAPLTDRTQEQTDIAKFFANNPVPMYRNALCDLLEAEPMELLATTQLFAQIDAAVVTTFIQTWRTKYEVGFWRPFQAIAGALTDGNPATNPHPGTVPWAPLIANPAYSDYTSGHGSATSPFAQVLRRTLGDHTTLVLKAGALTRTYTSLRALENDALNARIWGGLHFRTAMEDTYRQGHRTANRVMRASAGRQGWWEGHHDDHEGDSDE